MLAWRNGLALVQMFLLVQRSSSFVQPLERYSPLWWFELRWTHPCRASPIRLDSRASEKRLVFNDSAWQIARQRASVYPCARDCLLCGSQKALCHCEKSRRRSMLCILERCRWGNLSTAFIEEPRFRGVCDSKASKRSICWGRASHIGVCDESIRRKANRKSDSKHARRWTWKRSRAHRSGWLGWQNARRRAKLREWIHSSWH